MKPVFHPEQQSEFIESKIVVALERISEAFRVLLWNESKESSLSPIQIQILIFLLFHDREQCKVSYLAQEFNMSKATISDSVKLLLQKELVLKSADATDTRSYVLLLTEKGRQTAERSAHFASAIEKPLHAFSREQNEAMYKGLQGLIRELNKAGVITLQRMCFNCSHYQQQPGGGHYCSLIQSRLAGHELRIDCPEHQKRAV